MEIRKEWEPGESRQPGLRTPDFGQGKIRRKERLPAWRNFYFLLLEKTLKINFLWPTRRPSFGAARTLDWEKAAGDRPVARGIQAERDAAPLPAPRLGRLDPHPCPGARSWTGPLRPSASLSPSVPAERRSLARWFARSPCALPEMSHYNGTSSTPHSLFSSPCTMWIHSRQPCGEERAGRRGKEAQEEEEEEAREGAGAALPSPPVLLAALTPAAHPALGRKVVAAGGSGLAPAVWGSRSGPSPPPHTPPGLSALGLFHWRRLPKMVICVRGRECGFPCFRVTCRDRDSLSGSRARRESPPHPPTPGLGKGRGAAPEAAARASAPGFGE